MVRHHAKALDELKNNCFRKGIWIEEGGYLDKEPPLTVTAVMAREAGRDKESGEVTLKITPQNGDKVYYEINGDATEASLEE